MPLTLFLQHAAIDPTSAAARHSAQVALEWFGHQRSRFEKERGAPRNINTMAPFYALAGFLSQGVDGQTWQREWCEEWARWLMDELPRTQEGGFQHGEPEEPNVGAKVDDPLQSPTFHSTRINSGTTR